RLLRRTLRPPPRTELRPPRRTGGARRRRGYPDPRLAGPGARFGAQRPADRRDWIVAGQVPGAGLGRRMSIVTLPLPRLGETMEEGRIVGWLKQPGDAFRRGEILLEVET